METGDANQVGIIENIVMNHEIIISNITNPQKFGLDGLYFINTNDDTILNSIKYIIGSEVNEILSDLQYRNRLSRVFNSMSFHDRGTGLIQLNSFFIALFITTFYISIAIVNQRLYISRSMSILIINGINQKKIFFSYAKELFISLISGYLITQIIFLIFIPRTLFLNHLLFNLFFTSGFIIFYFLIFLIVNIILNFRCTLINDLNGKKNYKLAYLICYLSKAVLIVVLSVRIYNLLQDNNFITFEINRHEKWEMTENIHRIIVAGGRIANFNDINRFDNQKKYFYYDLTINGNGFFIDTSNMRVTASFEAFPPNFEPHLLNRIPNITVSPSYFVLNPIFTKQGNHVENYIINDSNTINILIPNSHFDLKEEIEKTFLSLYSDADYINFIEVANEQNYFSFNENVQTSNFNFIEDPITILLSGPIATKSYIASGVTHSLFFKSYTNNPFQEIFPFVYRNDLESQILNIESLYSNIRMNILNLQERRFHTLIQIIILSLTCAVLTFNVISIYFNNNKYEIFYKFISGFSKGKQLLNYWLNYSTLMIVIIIFSYYIYGFYVLKILTITVIFDILITLCFQSILLKKHYSIILKGER